VTFTQAVQLVCSRGGGGSGGLVSDDNDMLFKTVAAHEPLLKCVLGKRRWLRTSGQRCPRHTSFPRVRYPPVALDTVCSFMRHGAARAVG